MRKIALFAAAAFIVIGIDAWLCIRTIAPGALADWTFNPLISTAGAKSSPVSHEDNDLVMSH